MQFLTVRRIPLALLGFIILAAGGLHAQTTGCAGQPDVGSDRANNESQGAAITSCRNLPDPAENRRANGPGGPPLGHMVCLSWKASTSRHVIGYNIYRRLNSTRREKLNLTPIRSTQCMDGPVFPGYTYRYHVRAVDSTGKESAPSNHAIVQLLPGSSY